MFNAAAETMFRCTAANAIGQQIEQFVPERFHAAHKEQKRGESLRLDGGRRAGRGEMILLVDDEVLNQRNHKNHARDVWLPSGNGF